MTLTAAPFRADYPQPTTGPACPAAAIRPTDEQIEDAVGRVDSAQAKLSFLRSDWTSRSCGKLTDGAFVGFGALV
jgi:hypothetical protein